MCVSLVNSKTIPEMKGHKSIYNSTVLSYPNHTNMHKSLWVFLKTLLLLQNKEDITAKRTKMTLPEMKSHKSIYNSTVLGDPNKTCLHKGCLYKDDISSKRTKTTLPEMKCHKSIYNSTVLSNPNRTSLHKRCLCEDDINARTEKTTLLQKNKDDITWDEES